MEYVDGVDQPQHYGGKDYPYQLIHVIEAWGLNFCVGTAVKYIGRAGKRPGESYKKDLHKAIWYLRRELEQVANREHSNLNGVNFEEQDGFVQARLPIEERRKEQQRRTQEVESKMDVEVISDESES